MKKLVKLGMGIVVLSIAVLVFACNGSTKKKSAETQEQMAAKVYTCPMHPEVVKHESGSCPKCGMNLVEKSENMKHSTMPMNDSIYTCPMHPEVVKQEPGSCPKCGMSLEIKKSDMEHTHDGHMHD